mmetsp:Transcript_20196/g.49529  ORF Transcript_20196/g.49529 Transcript_20196/m.49529 type:complete len:386 (+) Transcript_20196:96-1253(+)
MSTMEVEMDTCPLPEPGDEATAKISPRTRKKAREKERRNTLNQHYNTLLSYLKPGTNRRMEKTAILEETIQMLKSLMQNHIQLVTRNRALQMELAHLKAVHGVSDSPHHYPRHFEEICNMPPRASASSRGPHANSTRPSRSTVAGVEEGRRMRNGFPSAENRQPTNGRVQFGQHRPEPQRRIRIKLASSGLPPRPDSRQTQNQTSPSIGNAKARQALVNKRMEGFYHRRMRSQSEPREPRKRLLRRAPGFPNLTFDEDGDHKEAKSTPELRAMNAVRMKAEESLGVGTCFISPTLSERSNDGLRSNKSITLSGTFSGTASGHGSFEAHQKKRSEDLGSQISPPISLRKHSDGLLVFSTRETKSGDLAPLDFFSEDEDGNGTGGHK